MSLLHQIDYYGTRLTFFSKGKEKYTTAVGGIATMISFTLILITTFIIGAQVIFQKNPIITMSGFTSNRESTFTLENAKVFLPWRIEDNYGKKVDFEKYIFPRISYSISEREGDNDFNPTRDSFINYAPCSKEELKATNLNMGDYYCSDWKNLEIGGGWEYSFIKYIRLELYLCPNGEKYSPDGNCTDLDMLSTIFNRDDPWFFLIYYPTYDFNPDDLNEPFKIAYTSYFYSLSNIIAKIDRLFFKETILNDDQGWIFEMPINRSLWGYSHLWSDYSLYKEETEMTEGVSSLIYTLYLYGNNEKTYYARSYPKVQSAFATIAVFQRIIYLSTKIILGYFTYFMKQIYFFQNCFDCEDKNQTLKPNKRIITPTKRTSYRGSSKITQTISNLHLVTHINSYSELNKHETNGSPIKSFALLNQPIHKENMFNLRSLLYLQVYDSMKVLCLCCKNKSNYDLRTKIYNKATDILHKKLDMVEYIKQMNEINLIKKIHFNPIQCLGINLYQKINLIDDRRIEEEFLVFNDEKRNELIDYYANMLETNQLNTYDKVIYDTLNKGLKKSINDQRKKIKEKSNEYLEEEEDEIC